MAISLKQIKKLEDKVKPMSLDSITNLVYRRNNKYYNSDGTEWVKPANWDDKNNILIILTRTNEEED